MGLMYVSYFAFTFAAVLQLFKGPEGGYHALAVFVILFVTIGLPFSIGFIEYQNRIHTKKLSPLQLIDFQSKPVRVVFKPLFSDFLKSRDWFVLAILTKLLLLALVTALLIDSDAAQSACLFVVYCAYFGAVVVLRPYKKNIPFWMDSYTALTSVLTSIIPFLYLTHEGFMTEHSVTTGWVLLGLQCSVIAGNLLYSGILVSRQIHKVFRVFFAQSNSFEFQIKWRFLRFSGTHKLVPATQPTGSILPVVELVPLAAPPVEEASGESEAKN
eukprot:c4348_g1_i1.p1 GENE.c4348_g1_i1~~c4348_g1_i1.p1  ORF type:complete len:271 (-),score=71.00 c4348_g1_i1:115-927(-)